MLTTRFQRLDFRAVKEGLVDEAKSHTNNGLT
jgi:hypothetical protein